jgi:glutaredoxin-like YruB-family protein
MLLDRDSDGYCWSSNKKFMKNVTIYSTPTCHFCQMAKDFFKENDVAYTEYDVASDTAKRQEMIEKSEQMGVPVIIIGDELIRGFDKPKISELLDL